MSPIRTRVKSCEHCRQHRLRCDRISREPEPCTACWKRSVDCVLNHGNSRPPTTCVPSTGHSIVHHDEPLQHVPPFQAAVEDRITASLRPYNGADVHANNDFTMTASPINNCFSYFTKALHPHFPLLSLPLDVKNTLEASPLLFWTIITIASRHDRASYRALQPFVRKLIAGVLHPSGHGLQSCQALCLVCLWPFDAEDPNDDPSYL